jgi:DNA helicase-2/ATP-dependent DNA helicase PcrA
LDVSEFISLSSLNPDQLNAVQTLEGPLLVIAGPGSGKTKTLVERVVYLILMGVKSENIMVATFTEKAAKELITRVSNRLLELDLRVNLNEMYIGTLHSIFLRFLDENREHTRLKRNYRLLDQFDQKYFVFRNINEYLKVEDCDTIMGTHNISRWEKAQTIIQYLNKVSEECLDIDNLCQSDSRAIQVIGEFYKIYSKQLTTENSLDFSTIQSEALWLLQNKPSVLKSIQETIKYIMVDEYQDTNTIQERILLLLANHHHNICVVGDDDQGLYRFRGATIRNILEFPSNFNNLECKQVTLSTNYRSHPDIINFYNNWMNQCNWQEGSKVFRFPKTIEPRKDKFIINPSVIKVSNSDSWEGYYEEIYQFINYLVKKDVVKDYNQLAFLFKSVKNEHVIELANYLETKNINVFSPRSALFFEREEIQLLLGAIIFIFPSMFDDLKWNETAHLTIWDNYNTWKHHFADEIRKDPKKHEPLLKWCQRRSKEHLTLTKNTNYAFASLLYQLLEFPMFANYLQTDMNSNKTSLRASYNIGLLSKLLYKFEYIYNISVLSPKTLKKNLQDLFNTFLRFIIEGGIEEYEDFDEYAPSGCVSFMTIHQSKGLEFPVVLVGSLNLNPIKQYNDVDLILQNQYYSKQPFEPIEQIKYYDFWRLFYTAFSRPQNLLVLSTFEKTGVGRSPSKYFDKVYGGLKSWHDNSFNVSKLQLASIHPINIKHEYSFTSHILLYENCPLQYKFYKELEFVEVRTGGVLGGSLLHQTIEDIHKAVLRNEVSSLNDENITNWFNTNYFLLSKQQRAYLHQAQIDSLLKQVLRYRDNNSNRWHLIKEAEVDVSLVKDNYILKGTIDLIQGDDNTVELIDFKSGDKPDVNSEDPKTKSVLNQFRRQLEVYAHIIEQNTGHKVSKLHLYFPKEENGLPYVTFPSNKDNINTTIQIFDEVVQKIESKNYDMSHTPKSDKQCGNCDMRYHCNPRQYSN